MLEVDSSDLYAKDKFNIMRIHSFEGVPFCFNYSCASNLMIRINPLHNVEIIKRNQLVFRENDYFSILYLDFLLKYKCISYYN